VICLDNSTNRAVPLVRLETTSGIVFWSDNNGLVASLHLLASRILTSLSPLPVCDPDLLDRPVWLTVSSPGYLFPEDEFGFRGRKIFLVGGLFYFPMVLLCSTPGGNSTLHLARTVTAERLYRFTGSGLYDHTITLNRKVCRTKSPSPGWECGRKRGTSCLEGHSLHHDRPGFSRELPSCRWQHQQRKPMASTAYFSYSND